MTVLWSEIETRSGYLDVLDPKPESIHLTDIADSLGMTCRFGGHCLRYYSVAEHSVLVTNLLALDGHAPEVLRAGLMHDAAEAYLGDICRPLRMQLETVNGDSYEELTQRLDRVICARLGLDYFYLGGDQVKEADNWALSIEAEELMPSRGEGWHWTEPRRPNPLEPIKGLSPAAARKLFMTKWRSLV